MMRQLYSLNTQLSKIQSHDRKKRYLKAEQVAKTVHLTFKGLNTRLVFFYKTNKQDRHISNGLVYSLRPCSNDAVFK